jgi:CRP/FNR family cyclic AMP-dependent transcriptional regulator
VRVQVPITQDELADWTGMTRQSVARALSTLRADGFVSTHWMGLVIHRPDGLRAAIRSE